MGMTTNVSRTPIGWRLPDEEYIGRVKPDPRASYLQQHDDRILLSHQYRAHAHRMTACDIMPRWTGSDQECTHDASIPCSYIRGDSGTRRIVVRRSST